MWSSNESWPEKSGVSTCGKYNNQYKEKNVKNLQIKKHLLARMPDLVTPETCLAQKNEI
jgi:hypothetical protein